MARSVGRTRHPRAGVQNREGHNGAVSLDKLIVVAVAVSPGGKTVQESARQPVLLALCVDRSTRAAHKAGEPKRACQKGSRQDKTIQSLAPSIGCS